MSFTIDVEDIRTSSDQQYRVRLNVDRVLTWLHDRGVVGTAFIVGTLAESDPSLVRAIVDAGHEVGLHSWTHTAIEKHSPLDFGRDIKKGRELLQDISGQSVNGFRAPFMSLTARTPHAPEQIAGAGFMYSSSVLPAASPLFGLPGAPTTPFLWECGLLELPCPVTRIGPLTIPFLGGTYIRLLPRAITMRALRRQDQESVMWTYCHPWDFDLEERFRQYPETGFVTSILCFRGRRRMFPQLGAIINDLECSSLSEIASGLLAPNAAPLSTFSIAGRDAA